MFTFGTQLTFGIIILASLLFLFFILPILAGIGVIFTIYLFRTVKETFRKDKSEWQKIKEELKKRRD